MKRLFLYVFLLSLAACSGNNKVPDDVISQNKMIKIMVDLQVAEAKVKNLRVSADSSKTLFAIYELKIFDKYNVTPEDYKESYTYYLENYKMMTKINDEVLRKLDSLSLQQNDVK